MWRLSRRFKGTCLIWIFLALQINCFPSLENIKAAKTAETTFSKHADKTLDEKILEELRKKIDSLSHNHTKKKDRRGKLSEQLDNCSGNFQVQDLMDSFEVKQGRNKTIRTKCKTQRPDEVFKDVYMTTNQRSNATDNKELDNGTEVRNFLNGARLWPNGIVPYEIDESFTTSEIQIIENALQEVQNKTCMDFRVKTDKLLSELGFGSYVKFISGTSGCWSYVGRAFNGEQNIGLGSGCVTHKIVIHEMLHAIGMDHEHSRSDRDDYVTMHWENIIDGTKNANMKKYATYNTNPFDVSSLLQYSPKAFSKNRKPTMTLKDQELSFLAGKAEKLDFYDAKDINDRYQCADHCINKPECENGGYVGPDCKCTCPSGLFGTTCTDLDTDNDCGGFLDVSNGPEIIKSPNYPDHYPKGKQCLWLIKTSVGHHVKILIQDLTLPYSSSNFNCYHWLQLRYNLIGQMGPRICGEDEEDEYYTTKDGNPNMMYLLFDSRSSQDKEPSKGFILQASSAKPCESSPCLNNGTCTNGEYTYHCSCTSEWKGYSCSIPADPCYFSPCKQGGTCQSSGTIFSCKCTAEWKGEFCDKKVRPCDSSPCENGGSCTNVEKDFTCKCPNEWVGKTCNTKVFPCDSSPCANGGICSNTDNDFTCECPQEWMGKTCDTKIRPCDSSPCENGGTCANTDNDFTCQCPQEWVGKTCNTKVRPCDSSPCANGGICANTENDFTCKCPQEWMGKTCDTKIRPCDSSPCENGGTCANTDNDFTCTCPKEWVGKTCSTKVRPCDSSPCANGGICANTENDFTCKCPQEWMGKTCDTKIRPCDSSPCENGGTCANTDNDFTCKCPKEWVGKTCNTKVRPCDSSPCANGGICANIDNDFTCKCPQEWTGKTCDTKIRPCDSSPCVNGGICANTENDFTCKCPQEWMGKTCNTKIRPCDSSPCENGGACTNTDNDFTCKCPQEWMGKTCDTKIRPCDSSPCENGGACANTDNDFICTCPKEWVGKTCNTKVKPCDSSPCKNGGSCSNTDIDFTCKCLESWTGKSCNVPAVNKRCTFEKEDDCFLAQSENDFFNWNMRKRGNSTSESNGKNTAVKGNYYGLARGRKQRRNKSAIMCSKERFPGAEYCLQYFYSMRGTGTGSLNVSVTDASGNHPVLLKTGTRSQRKSWFFSAHDIATTSEMQVCFNATISEKTYSGVALDEISLTSGTCGCLSNPCLNDGVCVPEQEDYMCECPPGFTGFTCEIADVCDFEVEVENCFLMEPDTGDYTGWNQFSEDTDVEQYMPEPYKGTRYLFIATDSSYTIQNASLETPMIKFQPGEYCFRFGHYQNVESRLSYTSVTVDENNVMFSEGRSIQNWELRSVAVTLHGNSKIAVYAELQGDGLIAIDGVSLVGGDC